MAGSDDLLPARIRALSYWHTYLPGMVYDALLRCCVLFVLLWRRQLLATHAAKT